MTPETDAKASDIIGFFSCATVPAEFARKLERERDAAREHLAAIKHYLTKERDDALAQIVQAECRAERFCQERDEAREEAEYWKEAAKVPSGIFRSLEMARDQAKRDAEYYRARYEKLKDEREAAK